MTEASPAAPELCLRRGSIVWRGRTSWLVYDCLDGIGAFPIRPARKRPRRSDVLVEALADQVLTRIVGPASIRLGPLVHLTGSDVTYAGELSPPAMCRVSQTIVRLAAAVANERKWTADRNHRRRAAENRCAV